MEQRGATRPKANGLIHSKSSGKDVFVNISAVERRRAKKLYEAQQLEFALSSTKRP
jgi:cold shock CspA family protein